MLDKSKNVQIGKSLYASSLETDGQSGIRLMSAYNGIKTGRGFPTKIYIYIYFSKMVQLSCSSIACIIQLLYLKFKNKHHLFILLLIRWLKAGVFRINKKQYFSNLTIISAYN